MERGSSQADREEFIGTSDFRPEFEHLNLHHENM